MPALAAQGREMMERYYGLLASAGPINASLGGMMTAQGAWQAITTNFGREFLVLIQNPG
jgi:hypothetical protein